MLEKAISEWRQGMRGRLSEETIDELESHLREAVAELVRSGLTEERAFERATKELGSMSGLAREFGKMNQGLWLPIKFAIAVELLGVTAGVITLLLNVDSPGMKFLLASHVVLVVLGYSTTFLIGALGICYVGQRSFSGFPRVRMRALTRATFAFGCVGAIATIAAVVLGSFWANAAWGRYWGWDIKEVGGLAVMLWQLTFVAANWFVQSNAQKEQVLLLMSTFGNVVVAMAWFGSNLLSGTSGVETAGWVALVIAVAVNCAVFVAGVAPPGWVRRFRAEEKF
jgi:hypothetical protein